MCIRDSVYTGVEEMEFREEKEPSEKPGESILKVHASGICGSDMHAYHGKDERRIPPLILGHEVSGQIINGKLKDQISVLNPLITCRNCEYCKSGREHLCPDRVLLGMNRPCLLYTSPSPRDGLLSRMPSSA